MGDEARVLIVCTGNICRSPFIERLLRHELQELQERRSAEGGGILVSSAGTGALIGSAMDARAAAQLVAQGGDPSGFTARDLTADLIAGSDLVLTATREHRGQVAVMCPQALRRVFTFRDFADLVDGFDRADQVDDLVDGPNTVASRADSRSWVRWVTERAAAGRGLNPPLNAADADIVDPYRRADEVFETMAQQVIGSMPAVVRALAG